MRLPSSSTASILLYGFALKFSADTFSLKGRTLFLYVPPLLPPDVERPVQEVVAAALLHGGQCEPSLPAKELLDLGAVWYKNLNSSCGSGESRIRRAELGTSVRAGDFLRVHTDPKRYCIATLNERIVHDESEYIIVDKPAGVPVHPTVDNSKENVIACLLSSERSTAGGVDLRAPHRLDCDTSGLLVLAKTKRAAAWIGDAMRPAEKSCPPGVRVKGARKVYRALVRPSPSADLRPGGVLKHFLLKRKGTPKHFLPANRVGEVSATELLECGLKVLDVSRPRLVRGDALPGGVDAAAVPLVEVRIELLTGRTHQVRGQLGASGAPIFGDKLYGESRWDRNQHSAQQRFTSSPNLALQACELILPEQAPNQPLHWRLEKAWWSDLFYSSPEIL